MYEGGIREPLLVRWPAVVKPGSVVSTPVSSPDFFPTLLEVAGLQPQPGQVLDGVSLVPVFKGGTLPERALFWHYPHYGNQGGAPSAAIRRGDWKLIEWYEDRRIELFNLARDLGEQTDLAPTEPARAAALRAELHAWQQQVGAKFPIPNPNYDPAKPNGRFAARQRNIHDSGMRVPLIVCIPKKWAHLVPVGPGEWVDDSFELRNLLAEPQHCADIARLARAALCAEILATRDTGFIPEGMYLGLGRRQGIEPGKFRLQVACARMLRGVEQTVGRHYTIEACTANPMVDEPLLFSEIDKLGARPTTTGESSSASR